jgi:hypothetical protein
MKKIIFVLIILISFAFIFGCVETEEEKPLEQEKKETQTIVLPPQNNTQPTPETFENTIYHKKTSQLAQKVSLSECEEARDTPGNGQYGYTVFYSNFTNNNSTQQEYNIKVSYGENMEKESQRFGAYL